MCREKTAFISDLIENHNDRWITIIHETHCRIVTSILFKSINNDIWLRQNDSTAYNIDQSRRYNQYSISWNCFLLFFFYWILVCSIFIDIFALTETCNFLFYYIFFFFVIKGNVCTFSKVQNNFVIKCLRVLEWTLRASLRYFFYSFRDTKPCIFARLSVTFFR